MNKRLRIVLILAAGLALCQTVLIVRLARVVADQRAYIEAGCRGRYQGSE